MRFLPNPSASVAYNVNAVADQFQRVFQTSTFCNRLYSFFNKRWFFDQVLNDFLVRSFLRFGYEVSFEALDKGAIEILGPYGISYTFRRLAERISQLQSGFVVRRVRYDPWPPARQPSTIHPIEFYHLVLYCTVSDQIDLLSERKGSPFIPSFSSLRIDCPYLTTWEDIRGSSEWRFSCGEPDEGRPSRPVRRAGISRPYYHYAFAMLLGSTLFVTFSCMWDFLSSWVDNRSSFIWIRSRCSLPRFFYTFAVFFIMLFAYFLRSNLSLLELFCYSSTLREVVVDSSPSRAFQRHPME
ncbi:uncharacterized protein LOC130824986 [Amaranthus tricolor]|uniref:uncharacterized protein LOC130824986 n=1 Tax=Amaranthus tricolor TaxID=29722 RepID=UPI00258AE590|nr:uncharacterized protein LOC130824986 [Amaranthus tricolor]